MKKKFVSMVIICILGLTATNAMACDKWKGEWFSLSSTIKEYYDLYQDYKNGELTKTKFIFESENLISDINELLEYIEDTESCPHKDNKYEQRKKYLLNAARTAVLTMRGGEFLKLLSKK